MLPHDHLKTPLSEERTLAVRHMMDKHGYRVQNGVEWGRVAIVHASLHARDERQVPPDNRIGSGKRPDEDRPSSGPGPA